MSDETREVEAHKVIIDLLEHTSVLLGMTAGGSVGVWLFAFPDPSILADAIGDTATEALLVARDVERERRQARTP